MWPELWFSFYRPLSYSGSGWHFQMFMTHPTFRALQSVAMPLTLVKVSGTTGTVKQGVQKELAALRLALFAGSIRMAWLIDCACQEISPGEFIFQEAPRGWRESLWPSGGIRGLIVMCFEANKDVSILLFCAREREFVSSSSRKSQLPFPTSVWVEQNEANGFQNSKALYRRKTVLFFLPLLLPLSWIS